MTELKKEENIGQEEVQELIAKYDKESAFQNFQGVMKWIVTIIAISFTVYQIYTIVHFPPEAQIHRSLHLAFGLTLIFLLYPAFNKGQQNKVSIWNILLSILGAGVGIYWLVEFDDLMMRVGWFTTLDLVVGGIALVLVLEAARRVVGLPIVIIAIVFILYALFGNLLPGFFQFRGVTLERLTGQMFFTLEGILGTPLMVSSSFIFVFILFGVFLEKTGVGEYFNDLAMVIAGKRIGGPAKVTIFSSALQGTISGSSVANVVTSGAFTIPLMKKLGYRKEFAAAVEASSSTGGQIMPPVMGAAAFIMVEFINVPYGDIAKAALLPALLFFAGIWMMVHFEAKRSGLRGLTEEEMPNRKEVWKKLYLLLPIVLIITLLLTNMTPEMAALWGILATIVVGAFRKETRMSIVDIIMALADGAKAALGVIAATACAGIVVGVVTLTGLGQKFANGLLDLADGNVFLVLFFTMIASLILGMGVPTTANYIITATTTAPAIVALGYPMLSAHMFAFYFGVIADITPPVALAAFAASAIAKSDPIKTGVQSAKVSIAAFIVPFIFVFSPKLLMIDTTWTEALWVVTTSTIGMIGVSVAMVGYWLRQMPWYERLLAFAGGILLIYPGLLTDVIGIGLLGAMYVVQHLQTRKKEIQPSQELSN
ncbi:TRAP transporter permease [Risungbinella massiliensis]|uniref:TRAP transporter permease n=1 Tax=Risungbinella massiliensis TaxID=1329796 RepID=UPI0005CC65F3|nr:TRAP transporter permease [Risungbinella massiliensis]